MADIGDWLSALGLERYRQAFVDNDIDDRVLPALTNEDLLALGVSSLGHRKRLREAIAGLAPKSATDVARTVPQRAPLGPAATRSLGAELSRSLPPRLRAALEARGYEIEDVLGRGGMGEVFLARQTSVDREVAIKTLHVRDDPDGAARFAREARAIAALRHPHSVRLYDYVTADDGAACIVMEHVQGEALRTVLERERRIGLERIVPILVQVCGALAEAHAMGIVHRDLKPGNILLQEVDGYRDFARVLDFGLARWATADESRLTRTGHVFGTPRYLSPEQVQGQEVTPRSDLYSLGVLLFEALAGEPPFAGDLEASLMFKHLKESAPSLPADVVRPTAVDRLLEKLLAKAPALRPPSANALREELAALLERRALEVTSMPPPAPRATERRQVVVVHAEYFDRERLALETDDAAHELTRRCHVIVDAIARRRGGFLDARTPHGSVLVFGAPVARRDDVGRALDAALDTRAQLAAIGERAPAITPRIGVADGRAVAGGIDHGDGGAYLVTGAPLAEAARLVASAAPGEVRITPSLAERAAPSFGSTSARDPSKDEAVLTGRRTDETDASLLPFVGRRPELDRLVELLEDCRAPSSRPRGRIVVVAGEAGIGKSRLVERLQSEARKRGVRCAKGLVFDTDVARREDAIHQIVGSLLDLPDDGDRVAALERRIGPSALRAEQWPFLYHFLDIPLPGPMQRLYDAMEPAARLGGYRDMLAALLASETREEPILLLLEDVHWASGPILDAIETLCSVSGSLRMLLVLTTRVEGEERWRHALVGHGTTRIELEPLAATDAQELALRLGVTESSHVDAVVERAGGHPLLLTELARSDPRSGEAMPVSVDGLVQARVDRLPEVERAAIQIGAVLGARFELATLRDVLGEPEYDCTLLADYRLVRRDSTGAFMFTHALVRDAVYGSLVDEHRRALHERCADRVRDPELAATHLERARSPRAPGAYLHAARRAIGAHRIVAARGLLTRGVNVAERGSRDHVGLLERLAHVELLLGNAVASIDAYRSVVGLTSDDTELYHAYVGLGAALRVASRYPEALDALDAAEGAAERAGLPTAQVHHIRGNVCFSTGELARCQASHELALSIAADIDDPELRAKALSGLADAHYGQGRLVSAARTWQECIDVARERGLLGIEATNLAMLAIANVFLDDASRATTFASQAVDLTQRLARKRDEALARGAASLAALARGDFQDALAQGEHALEATRAIGTVVFEETGHYYVAQAHLGLGRRNDAKRHVDQGLALCREHGMHFVGAALLGTLARLCWTDSERGAILDEGERVLGERSLSFNRFWFHENAIAASLAAGDRARAQHHADALARATSKERVPYIERIRKQVEAAA